MESWILGFQMTFDPRDYASPETFEALMRREVEACRRAFPGAWEGDERLLVFPETLGAWLLFTAGRELYGGFPYVGTLSEGLTALAGATLAAHPGSADPVLQRLAAAYHQVAAGNTSQMWFAMMVRNLITWYAEDMLELHGAAVGRLARDYAAWVVPGSLYAPRVQVDPAAPGGWRLDGDYGMEELFRKLAESHGLHPPEDLVEEVYAQSLVYGPSGELSTVVPKCFPTESEAAMGILAASPRCWHAIDTGSPGLGTVGVLICADSWYPPGYRRGAAEGVRVFAVPSYGMDRTSWNQPWGGFSNRVGWVPPYDRSAEQQLVQLAEITEGGAWATFALAGRMAHVPSARVGVDVFAVGTMWESLLGGRSVVVYEAGPVFGARTFSSECAASIDQPAVIAVRLTDGAVRSGDDVTVLPGID